MSQGKIVQIIGAVVDVEFPRESLPKVYDALKLADVDLTLEVQQQLGDGVVRTIALGSTDGLKRGMAVSDTDAAISVPVGEQTLGHGMSPTTDGVELHNGFSGRLDFVNSAFAGFGNFLYRGHQAAVLIEIADDLDRGFLERIV